MVENRFQQGPYLIAMAGIAIVGELRLLRRYGEHTGFKRGKEQRLERKRRFAGTEGMYGIGLAMCGAWRCCAACVRASACAQPARAGRVKMAAAEERRLFPTPAPACPPRHHSIIRWLPGMLCVWLQGAAKSEAAGRQVRQVWLARSCCGCAHGRRMRAAVAMVSRAVTLALHFVAMPARVSGV